MIEKSAKYFTEKLVSKKLVRNEDRDIYQYGIEVLLSTAINIMLLLVIGIITKTVLLSICHFLILATVRTLTGGYHASTYLKCEIVGCVTYITIVLCLEKVTQIFCVSNWLIVCSLMGIITLINFGVTNKRAVIGKELKRLKKSNIERNDMDRDCSTDWR